MSCALLSFLSSVWHHLLVCTHLRPNVPRLAYVPARQWVLHISCLALVWWQAIEVIDDDVWASSEFVLFPLRLHHIIIITYTHTHALPTAATMPLQSSLPETNISPSILLLALCGLSLYTFLLTLIIFRLLRLLWGPRTDPHSLKWHGEDR